MCAVSVCVSRGVSECTGVREWAGVRERVVFAGE